MESFLSGRAFSSSGKNKSSENKSSGFQSLMAQATAGSGSNGAQADPCNPQEKAQMEVIKGKDGIERIIVTCGCGKRIELLCEYE